MEFTKEASGLHFHNFPFACMNAKFGAHIGQTIGSVQAFDVPNNGLVWIFFFQILIELNITIPLAKGRTLNFQET